MAAVFAVVGALTCAVLWDLYDGDGRTSAFVQSIANSLEDEGLGADTALGDAPLWRDATSMSRAGHWSRSAHR
jgi:hypothetical protein